MSITFGVVDTRGDDRRKSKTFYLLRLISSVDFPGFKEDHEIPLIQAGLLPEKYLPASPIDAALVVADQCLCVCVSGLTTSFPAARAGSCKHC